VAICLSLPPLLTYGLALTLGMERFHALRAAGIAFGLIGAAALGLAKASAGIIDPVWIFAALIGPVFVALGNIYRTIRWPPGATALSLAPGMLLAGAAFLLAYIAATGANLLPPAETRRAGLSQPDRLGRRRFRRRARGPGARRARRSGLVSRRRRYPLWRVSGQLGALTRGLMGRQTPLEDWIARYQMSGLERDGCSPVIARERSDLAMTEERLSHRRCRSWASTSTSSALKPANIPMSSRT
jgi:hypothetical protein